MFGLPGTTVSVFRSVSPLRGRSRAGWFPAAR